MNTAHVWKENIERVQAFYKSDLYRYLTINWPAYIRSICKGIMEDPDACDKGLYIDKADELSGMQLKCRGTSCLDRNTVLGMDCVIGWKRIFDIHKGDIAWIDDYALIRGRLSSHMLWPRCGSNTINTVRARVFNDRIDYTLYDIRMFYQHDKSACHCQMISVFENPITLQWFSQFKSFEDLAERMHLSCFLDDNCNVIDMSDTAKTIQCYGENMRTVDSIYLQNLKQILVNYA